jgi:hypothetical protein
MSATLRKPRRSGWRACPTGCSTRLGRATSAMRRSSTMSSSSTFWGTASAGHHPVRTARERIGNRFLVEQLAQRLRLVERADDLPFELAAVRALHYHYQFPHQPDGSTIFFWELASRTHQRWEAAAGCDGARLGAVGKSRRAARRLVRRAACARHPLARHDRRAASDPQCRSATPAALFRSCRIVWPARSSWSVTPAGVFFEADVNGTTDSSCAAMSNPPMGISLY